MFDWLEALVTDSPVTYLVVWVAVTFDAVIPNVPSESLLITGGVLAARGDLMVGLVIASGWIGALCGDSLAYVIGRRFGDRVTGRLLRRDGWRARLASARDLLERRTWLLAVANFLPGARTAAMLSAGWLGLPVRRFYTFVVPGGLLWSGFTTLLGYAGGSAFEGSLWLPLGASLAVAVLIGLGAEALEQRTRRRGGARSGRSGRSASSA